MPAYDFANPRAIRAPSGRNDRMSLALDLRGLDMVTPVDMMSDGRTPFAKNFRLYAQQSDDRRVAVSSRKGPGFYTHPLLETMIASNEDTTGAAPTDLGVIIGQYGMKYTATNSERLTRVDFKIADPDVATGPILIDFREDDNGVPGRLITTTSLQSGDIGSTPEYASGRFLACPKLQAGTTYWFILHMQDDGTGNYALYTTTTGAHAYRTDSTLSQLTEQDYSLNFRLYTSPDQTDKGRFRFTRDNGENTTMVAYGDSVYTIDEPTNSLVKLQGGFNAASTEVSFTSADNKAFFVNGIDPYIFVWDGTFIDAAANMVPNSSFTTDLSGWTAHTGTTMTRSTTTYSSAPASMSLTAASGVRRARFNATIVPWKQYRVRAKIMPVGGPTQLHFAIGSSTLNRVLDTVAQPGQWTTIDEIFVATESGTTLGFGSLSRDIFIDDIEVKPTGIEYIYDPELPALKEITFHKDRMFGVVASDPNKLVFSEAPGNPAFDPTGAIPTTAKEQWYYAWRSVNFWYVPRPHNGSPITGLVPFQDSLTIFTQDKKYIFSGYDLGSFNLRESTGSKGALSRRGIAADENRIYFVGVDGLYEFDGARDSKISSLVNPLFDSCGHKEKITVAVWKNMVRFYMASQGSPVNDSCLIWHKDIQEMMYDTETYVNSALYYSDADDDQSLIEFSSLVTMAFIAEQDYNSLGAPIDFEYRLKYDSMGAPAQKKRIKRYFPILQGVDSTFPISLAMDKDFEDSPRMKELMLTTNGAKWGEFNWGDGTLYGGDKSFSVKRQSYSGYAYYWQFRIARRAVNNRVAFIGAQFSYKTKRL